MTINSHIWQWPALILSCLKDLDAFLISQSRVNKCGAVRDILLNAQPQKQVILWINSQPWEQCQNYPIMFHLGRSFYSILRTSYTLHTPSYLIGLLMQYSASDAKLPLLFAIFNIYLNDKKADCEKVWKIQSINL